jgi:cytochrome c55X
MYRCAIVASCALCWSASLYAGEQRSTVVDGLRAAELERLVKQDCGSCHGMTLKGGLGPDIRAETLEGTQPEAIKRIILDGVVGTPMPPWRGLLSEREAEWIALYLLREGGQ